MKKTVLLALFISVHAFAEYRIDGSIVEIYESREYGVIALEIVGMALSLYGVKLIQGSQNAPKVVLMIPCVASGGLLGLDILRRIFHKETPVALRFTESSLEYLHDSLSISWQQIRAIKATRFISVSHGTPRDDVRYEIEIHTIDQGIPVIIRGEHLSEPLNVVLSLLRKYFNGTCEIDKVLIQDITPRPSHVCMHNCPHYYHCW